ncbi:MAG: hypothetical protein WAP23_01185 [Candidatus Spechtbacterales bacterium]
MKATLILSKLVLSGNLPHALLFTGLSRSAKKEISFGFAKFLFHGRGEFGEFIEGNCACDSCGKVSGGVHPDFFVLDKSPIQIEEIRSLKNKFSSSPFFSDRKIAIITNTESMRSEAANSLLKLLEEPRGNALIILIAPFRSSILATIASRALEIKFSNAYEKSLEFAETIQALERGSLHQKFAIARSYNLQNKSELLCMLDAWLVKLRDGLFGEYDENNLYFIKKLLKVKKIISTTNANPELLLEEAVLH